MTRGIGDAPPTLGREVSGLGCTMRPMQLFALAAAHVFGRFGYDESSPLRGLAIVGIGHHPDTFASAETAPGLGWDVSALRELRRAHVDRLQT